MGGVHKERSGAQEGNKGMNKRCTHLDANGYCIMENRHLSPSPRTSPPTVHAEGSAPAITNSSLVPWVFPIHRGRSPPPALRSRGPRRELTRPRATATGKRKKSLIDLFLKLLFQRARTGRRAGWEGGCGELLGERERRGGSATSAKSRFERRSHLVGVWNALVRLACKTPSRLDAMSASVTRASAACVLALVVPWLRALGLADRAGLVGLWALVGLSVQSATVKRCGLLVNRTIVLFNELRYVILMEPPSYFNAAPIHIQLARTV
jgi:hypothetical protein